MDIKPASDYWDDTPIDDRSDKPWPKDQDCPGCDKHIDGPHRFGCAIKGTRRVIITVKVDPRTR